MYGKATHWEIELSGMGLWDGVRRAIPRGGQLNDQFPQDVLELPFPTLAKTGDTYQVKRFRLHHRRDDGVFVYREER